MNQRFLFLFLFIALPVYADKTISISHLNDELQKNYSFSEKSLNQSNIKIESSSGRILFDENGVTVNIISPFKENYRLEGTSLEIHDIFLDQKQLINLKNINNPLIDILINGIDENSDQYIIKFPNNLSVEIYPIDQLNPIKFIFKDSKLYLIRYKDNAGIEHGIELKEI